jgi:hypothetical protein
VAARGGVETLFEQGLGCSGSKRIDPVLWFGPALPQHHNLASSLRFFFLFFLSCRSIFIPYTALACTLTPRSHPSRFLGIGRLQRVIVA